MAKTLLTQKIESALKVWHPANYGGYRLIRSVKASTLWKYLSSAVR